MKKLIAIILALLCSLCNANPFLVADPYPATATRPDGASVTVNGGSPINCTIESLSGGVRPSSDRQTMYSVMIFSPPGGAWVGVRIVDEATGSAYESAQISTNIPAATQALTPNCYASVGGTSSVVGLTFGGMWFDTDN